MGPARLCGFRRPHLQRQSPRVLRSGAVVEVGKTSGPARIEAQAGGTETDHSVRGNVIPYPAQARAAQPETGVAAAPARAPQAQAYLSMWVAHASASQRVLEDAQRLA